MQRVATAAIGREFDLGKRDQHFGPRFQVGGFQQRPGKQAWVGEHVGKWLHAATLAWVYTGDVELRAKLPIKPVHRASASGRRQIER